MNERRYNSWVVAQLMRLKMLLVKHLLWANLKQAAANSAKAQAKTLKQILKANRNTIFGQKHNFANIETYEEFKQNIPIQTYEDLREYIEKQIETSAIWLNAAKPVIYAQTSGTTGKSKLIPITQQSIADYKKAQRILSYIHYSSIPSIYSGKILAIASPAVEGYVSDGTPFGSMSGFFYKNMPNIILSKYALPAEIFDITDYETKYRLIAALAASQADISAMASANPSTLIRISEVINQFKSEITNFIVSGNLAELKLQLTANQKKFLAPYCIPNPKRAELIRQKDILTFRDLWPNLKAVVTWTGGNCALLIPKLHSQLADNTKIIEAGYLSSEFRGTITVDCESNLGLPTIQSNFFEFTEKSDWDNGSKETLSLERLERGKYYYVIITTPDGLYRYFINDIIEVTGRFGTTPTIRFVQKGKGVTNFTGEKLYESQIVEAALQVRGADITAMPFFIMLADEENFSYRLYVELEDELNAADLDNLLGEMNIEYQSKRKSGRIKPLEVKRVKPGTGELYKRFCIDNGQREGQFKLQRLQYKKDETFPFEEHLR